MRIALYHQTLGFGANLVAAELSPGDEELLLGREAVDVGRSRLAFERFLIGEIGDLRSAQVADTFAEHELAVVVDIFLDEVIVELIGDAGSSLLEVFEVGVDPPVAQAAEEIELRALVVEAMRDFVADDDADRAVIHGIDGIDIESRRLQNSGGELDVV